MEATNDAVISLKSSRLFSYSDLNTLIEAVVELLKTEAEGLESIVVLSDASGQLQFDQSRSSLRIDHGVVSWLSDHFKKHPGLNQKLLRSEIIALTGGDAGTNSQHSPVIHANVVLAPVLHEGSLVAAFGVISRGADPPSMTALEHIRWCALEAGPPLARMRELEMLRNETRQFRQLAEQLAAAERVIHGLNEEAAQLNARSAMRANLQSNVAHDMRTPLAAIRGYARMILDGHAGEVSRTQREYLEVAVDNTNKLIHLVNWMTRLADAEQSIALTTFDLRQLWRECLSTHAYELGAGAMHLDESLVNAPASFEVLADRDRMQRALDQIIRTAIQFAGEGAHLCLEFSRPRNGGIGVKLSGMKRAIPSGAAEFPFNGSLQHSLSDVHDIIGMHGGRFFVRKSEEGSVFMFTLPAIGQEQKDAVADRRSA